MKLLTSTGIAALAFAGILISGSAVLLAQRQPGGAGFGRMINPGGAPLSTTGGGFGRLIYPGTGGPVAFRGPRVGGGYLAPPSVPHPENHARSIIVPYPVYYGGYYYGYDAPPAPNAGGYYTDPNGGRQDAPVVILNQNFAPDTVNPSFQDYSNTPLPPPTIRRYETQPQQNQDQSTQAAVQPGGFQGDQPSSVYLIAMKDHTIYAAIGYWTEGPILHYVTQDNVHNRVALDLVDRAFTKQLNDERHIDMPLPPDDK